LIKVYINGDHRAILSRFNARFDNYQIVGLESDNIPANVLDDFRRVCIRINEANSAQRNNDISGLLAALIAATSIESKGDANRGTSPLTPNITLSLDREYGASSNSSSVRVNTPLVQAPDNIHPAERKEPPTNIERICDLANLISNKIRNGKAPAPSFTKHTPANYKKIKNFVHHHTNVWLKKQEIVLFINKMAELDNNNNSVHL
jgi:hypothetical protein